jgi:Flp pilus assembly protein TadD
LETAIAAKGVATSPLYAAQAKQYREACQSIRLANIKWTFQAGQRRTALVLAKRMVESEPNSPSALMALADTYRALGPWTPDVGASEITDKAKKEALKAKTKLTPQEEEAKAMETPAGQLAWKENAKNAEELYWKAISLDGNQVEAFRSLGALYEKSGDLTRAREAYQSFVDKAPSHPDNVRVRRKLESMREGLSTRK